MQDIRFAVRVLIASPMFSLVAMASLALGIGANAAMFSIVNTTILQPLPYPDAERLVYVRETTPEGHDFSVSVPNYVDFRDGVPSFASLAAFRNSTPTIVHGGEPERVRGLAVTHNYFSMLGVAPAIGRGFVAAEGEPGADASVVMLSHELWRQRFGESTSVIGSEIDLEGRSHVVVGIMPADFETAGAQLWTVLEVDPHGDRSDHWLGLVGRLAPGASIESAQAELATVMARIAQDFPRLEGWGTRIEPLSETVVGPQFRLTAFTLFGAVGALLLLACANLAGLQVARSIKRTGELGIRAALGADRLRLIRQMLVESGVLAAFGVVAGLILANLAVGGLQAIELDAIPRLDEVRIDGLVVAFASLVGVVSAMLTGLLPALRASRPDVNDVLKQGGRSDMSRGGYRTGNLLVVAQLALATVLLVGAGLLMRSFFELRAAEPGFVADAVVTVDLQLGPQYAEGWQRAAFFSELSRELSGHREIGSVGAITGRPFSGFNFMNSVTPLERAAEVNDSGYLQSRWRVVTPGFFETMGVPLLRGRVFTENEDPEGQRSVVIGESMAATLWPGEDAIGKQFYWGGVGGTPLTVIGVVGDYQDVEFGAPSGPVMFLPYSQIPWRQMAVVVRTSGDTGVAATMIRDQIRAMDPALAVPAITTLDERISDAVSGPRFRTLVLSAFSLVALLLAAIGIFGSVAVNVGRRQREVGLRIALGAAPESVIRSFVAEGARLAVTGLLIGVAGAWVLSRLIEGLLFRTPPLDLSVFVTASTVLGAVALAATFIPASRAGRISPMQALREE